MRSRNILKGRCGHRPLQTTTENAVFLGRTGSSAPTKDLAKRNDFLFRAVGVDAHLGAKSRALRGCASKLACGRRIDPPSRTKTPPRRADGRYCIGFRFSPLQMRVKNVQVGRKNAVLPVLCRGFYFPTQKRSKILFVISSRMVRPVTSPRADMAASTSTSTASGVMPCRMDSSAASSAFPARRTASA